MKRNILMVAVAAAFTGAACAAYAISTHLGDAVAFTGQHIGLIGSLAAAPLALHRKDDTGGNADPAPATIADVGKKLREVIDNVKNFGEDIAKKMKDGETVTADLKQKADTSLTQMTELQARLNELEQKAARDKGDGQPQQLKSLGEKVVEHDDVKALDSSARKSVRVRIDRKDIMNVTGTVGAGASPANSLVPGDRQPGIVAPPMRKMTVRDLLIPGETGTNSVEYTVETGFTNNAATVAEGAQKPKSDITFNLKNAPVRTIAHLFKASRQILDDAPTLRSYIDGRARYGLAYAEELQLLLGNGTGQNILGIVPQATAFAPALTLTDATPIDRLRLAILQVVLAEYPATGFVLNPIDWAGIELTKDDEGRYIIAQPMGLLGPRLWGLPVVETQAMAQNAFLTGAFAMAAQIFDRMEVEVLLSTENVDDFEKNMVTLRAEERLALCVYRPEAFVTGAVSA